MHDLLQLIKRILGTHFTKKLRPVGHGFRAFLAATKLGFPAKKLVIVGVTGTKGKTSTTVYIGRLANLCGIKTGYISTALINEGDFDEQNPDINQIVSGESLNTQKMTTLDPYKLQGALAEMVGNNCKVVVVEMSSQGLEQHRHWGINGFDEAIFLNLSPEHIESHGSFEDYRRAKSLLFKSIKANGVFISGEEGVDTEYMYEAIPISIRPTVIKKSVSALRAVSASSDFGLYKKAVVNGKDYPTHALADFDVNNMLVASLAVESLPKFLNQPSFVFSDILEHLREVGGIPGRMEWVIERGKITDSRVEENKGGGKNISILVDYAHDPRSMEAFLQTLKVWREERFFDLIYHVVSCDGAGRDDWKKPLLGKLSYAYADLSFITTDNYDRRDDPEAIVKKIAEQLPQEDKDKKFFLEVDRRKTFSHALSLAISQIQQGKKVLLVSTGVGSEYGLTQPDGVMDWDEKRVWIEEFSKKDALRSDF